MILPGILNQGGGLFTDTYGIPYVGFSLRKLNSQYRGACIRVVRTSDSEEQDIGFFNGYVNTVQYNSFVGESDHYIKTWYDQCGGLDMTMGNISPTTYAKLIIPETGVPYITVGDGVTGDNSFISDKLSFILNGTSSSLFFVFKINESEKYGFLVNTNGWNAENNGIIISFDDRSASSKYNYFQVLATQSGNDPVVSSANYVLEEGSNKILHTFIDSDNTTALQRIYAYINSSSNLLTNTATTTPTSDPSSINANFFGVRGGVTINVYEAIIYDSDKQSVRANIRDNQNSYFSVY